MDPSHGDAYVLLANALGTLEKHSEAVAAADKALASSPNNADVLVNAGWVLATNGRAEEAVALMNRGLRLNPFPPDYYYGGLGDSLLFANRAGEALPAHQKCVQRLPDWVVCRLGLAASYDAIGNLEQARSQAAEAMRINPRMTADDNTYVRLIGVGEQRARVVAALRRAGMK
jgi:adenylate cyclase